MFADLSTRAVPDRLLALQAGSTLDRSARQPRTDHSRTLGTAMTANVARRTIPSVTFRPLVNNLDSSPPSLLLLLLIRRSGLAVACLTAVREVPGSNRAVGSCVSRKNHCDLQPLARAVRTFPAVPRSTQPSTLRGTVNEYQLSG